MQPQSQSRITTRDRAQEVQLKMPAARKRSSQELNSDNAQGPAPPSMLHRIRNMWQFANLFQFILLFGQALKLDDNLDIEVRRIPALAVRGPSHPKQEAVD
jgi:hypothetical protein